MTNQRKPRNNHRTLSWPIWIQSTSSYPISLGYILILFSHLCLGLMSGLLTTNFLIFCINFSCLPCKHCLPHTFDSMTLITYSEGYKLWFSSLCSFFHLPVTSSLLGPNILSYLLTYAMVQDILWKADGHSAGQTACFLYGTWRFITILTKTTISLRSLLMLTSHLCLRLPCDLLPSGLPTKTQ